MRFSNDVLPISPNNDDQSTNLQIKITKSSCERLSHKVAAITKIDWSYSNNFAKVILTLLWWKDLRLIYRT